MNQIDTAAESRGRFVERMIALARLRERIDHHDPRRALIDRLLRQMLLFSRMIERLGIAAPQGPLMRAVVREAELGCLQCVDWQRCRQWLDGRAPDDDYCNFCPNEGLFAVLPRQDSIQRPYAAD
jgi:hypothetical protein